MELLEARIYVEAPYDAVWRRFTVASEYAAWHSSPCRTFGSNPGDAVVWAAGDRVTYQGELLELEHGRGLAHTFAFEGFGFQESTRVDVAITAHGDTVLVEVRHDCTGAPRTREVLGPVGWVKSLSRLKTLLETGRPMPWPSADSPAAG